MAAGASSDQLGGGDAQVLGGFGRGEESVASWRGWADGADFSFIVFLFRAFSTVSGSVRTRFTFQHFPGPHGGTASPRPGGIDGMVATVRNDSPTLAQMRSGL